MDINDINNITYAINILQNSQFSMKDTSALQTPFFEALNDREFTKDDINTNIKECIDIINNNKIILDINEKLKLPNTLIYMYCLLDSLHREITYKTFVFMSFSEIKERYDMYIKNNQKKICDIAFTYIGMGHIIIIAYDILNNKFFFRYDGGSNNFDRDTNWEFIKNFDPLTTPISNMYIFEEVIILIEKTEDFYNFNNCVN